jgi:ATP-dependent Clp protease ATP-binding subunit ClpA
METRPEQPLTLKPPFDASAFEAHLKSRVKGQDDLIADLAKLIRRRFYGRSKDSTLCTLMFLGLPGTGKTTLARAIAEFIYPGKKPMLGFTGPELGLEGKWRLVGAPPGYQGSQHGGLLTRPILSEPRKLILFAEVERTKPMILDLFLEVMTTGRLTQVSSNQVADFSKTILIFESSADAREIMQIGASATNPVELEKTLKAQLVAQRILPSEVFANRIDMFYVFQPLEHRTVAEIALSELTQIAAKLGLETEVVTPELVIDALALDETISQSVRDTERMVWDKFGAQIEKIKQAGHRKVRFTASENGSIEISPVI